VIDINLLQRQSAQELLSGIDALSRQGAIARNDSVKYLMRLPQFAH
jgi:hypothetical protein